MNSMLFDLPTFFKFFIGLFALVNPVGIIPVFISMTSYQTAAARGYLTKDASGKDYHVEFGEFYAGVVDLTNPEAYAWYKEV
ncbi:MarC family protein, partial [Cronobacter sakazakii]|uniref:MarC family protein n=1 Tax=Cronobacter sakazakii TaxID=28141 RepID=UPI0023510C3C